MRKKMNEKGFINVIGVIVLMAITMLTLSFFHFDLRTETKSNATLKSNTTYVAEIVTSVWTGYLERPVTYFWNNIFIDLLWNSFVSNMSRVRDGKATDFENSAPKLQFN